MQNQGQDHLDRMPVLEARWLLVCLVAIVPLWLWPLDFADVIAQYGVAVLKVLGWVVGLGAIVVVSTFMLSGLGHALMKEAPKQSKQAAGEE